MIEDSYDNNMSKCEIYSNNKNMNKCETLSKDNICEIQVEKTDKKDMQKVTCNTIQKNREEKIFMQE